MARKVMISCAVTGSADTPGKNPAVPVTPEQIANSCLDAAKGGARCPAYPVCEVGLYAPCRGSALAVCTLAHPG